MFIKRFIFMIVAMSFVFGPLSIRAQDAGALLDLLVRKKLITDQEAEEVRAELTKESASTSAGKLKLSTPITELELYGDARLGFDSMRKIRRRICRCLSFSTFQLGLF